MRSDRGGEFYGRNDASGEQCPGSYARYLEQSGIPPQYTMTSTPSMNGIAERRNRTDVGYFETKVCKKMVM